MNFPFRYGINSMLLNNRGEKFLDAEFLLGIEPRAGRPDAHAWFDLDCLTERTWAAAALPRPVGEDHGDGPARQPLRR